MEYDEAKNIISAMFAVQEDKTKVWYVKMPHFQQLGDTSLVAPELYHLEDNGLDLNQYILVLLIHWCASRIKMILSIGSKEGVLMNASVEDQDPP